ncbi:uncharacterized protein O3C94_018445 [Discoglossus pictus]
MELLSENQLQKGFVEKTKSFCQYIYEKAEAKTLSGGQVITGCTLGGLLDSYVKVAVSGRISFLEDAMCKIYLEQIKSATQSAKSLYEEHMRSKHVNTQQEFQKLHDASKELAFKHFEENAGNMKKRKGESEDLCKMIENQRDEIWKKYEASSIQTCKELTQHLSMSLHKDIDQNKYHVLGGHKKFVADKENLIKKYNQEPEKGIKAEEVLQEFLKTLDTVEKIVLQFEQAKAEEPQRLQVTDRSDFSQLTKYICSYKPESKVYHRILIQLFGFSGHGKSSFVNSCMYVVGKENFKDHAGEAQSYGAKTIDRRGYKLTDSITIVDNRGFGKMDSFETWQIYAQLCNFVPLNQYVTWEENPEKLMEQLLQMEEAVPDLIVPVLVYSAEQNLSDRDSEHIKKFLKNAQKLTEILPFIIITKKLKGNAECLKQKFQHLGMEYIYTLENYILSDNVAIRGRHMDILTFLYNVLEIVDNKGSVVSKQQQHERRQFLKKMAFEKK